jgi:hypothetical protein
VRGGGGLGLGGRLQELQYMLDEKGVLAAAQMLELKQLLKAQYKGLLWTAHSRAMQVFLECVL